MIEPLNGGAGFLNTLTAQVGAKLSMSMKREQINWWGMLFKSVWLIQMLELCASGLTCGIRLHFVQSHQ